MEQQYYCYRCTRDIIPNMQLCCPICGDGFIEAISTAVRNSNPPHQQTSSNNTTQITSRSPSVSTSHVDSEISLEDSTSATQLTRTPLLNVFRRLLERSMVTEGFTLSSIDELEDFLAQVTSLLDALGQPVRPADLQLISTITMSAEELQQQSCCSICLEAFQVEESLSSLPCLHVFHHFCIRQWFLERDTCPVCRRQLSSQQDTETSSTSGQPLASPHSASSITLINASSPSNVENVNEMMVSGATEDDSDLYSSLYSPVYQQRHPDSS